jgi:hypothetical protein
MISRRKFLKIAGLSAAALGTGFSTGKLLGRKKSVYYAVYGFLPADEEILKDIVSAFKNKIKSNTDPVIISELKTAEVIKRIDLQTRNDSFSGNGRIIYNVKKIDKQIDADIIISDSDRPVYSLDEFNSSMGRIRSILKNRKAGYFFTAEYSETDFLSSIFNTKKKEIIIENEKGLADRIPFDVNYRNIPVDGPQGRTVIRIENGIARVHSASCRHGICKHSIADRAGSIIACAPNKVIIKVELV